MSLRTRQAVVGSHEELALPSGDPFTAGAELAMAGRVVGLPAVLATMSNRLLAPTLPFRPSVSVGMILPTMSRKD